VGDRAETGGMIGAGERLRARIVVFAHNEERRIAACLASLPLGEPGIALDVVVNGSTDRTAAIAREIGAGAERFAVHEYAKGGKARSWNRFVLDEAGLAQAFVFVDGDAVVVPGSIEVLLKALETHPQINAASAMPVNGRRAAAYRDQMAREHGLFGDLYALRGSFVARMRAAGVRLPEDLVGDDSLICALAKTDLGHEDHWQNARVLPCPDAGFVCEPTVLSVGSLKGQWGRMGRYALRHQQNRIVSGIMRGPGPAGLPRTMAELYREWLPRLAARRHPVWWWLDRQALALMAAQAEAAGAEGAAEGRSIAQASRTAERQTSHKVSA
jgi:cellulose synthase/poly-beta-1,6-N-acetylglucosamine synthase-like glycosyltransferase